MFKNQKSLSESSEAYIKQTGSRLRAHDQTFTSHQKQSKTKQNAKTGGNGGIPTKMGKIKSAGTLKFYLPGISEMQK